MRLLKSIKNKEHCLRLSGLSDSYDCFGKFVNVLQKIDVLPKQRYDDSMKILDEMTDMSKKIDHSTCAEIAKLEAIKCSKNPDTFPIKCVWPRYHDETIWM